MCHRDLKLWCEKGEASTILNFFQRVQPAHGLPNRQTHSTKAGTVLAQHNRSLPFGHKCSDQNDFAMKTIPDAIAMTVRPPCHYGCVTSCIHCGHVSQSVCGSMLICEYPTVQMVLRQHAVHQILGWCWCRCLKSGRTRQSRINPDVSVSLER